MKLIKGLLTLIGAIVVIGAIIAAVKIGPKVANFDSKALGAYMDMAGKGLETGDPAKGMGVRKKMVIPEGMTKQEAIDNAIEIMDEIGSEHGLAVVDHKIMPRSNGVFTEIRSYCSPSIADVFLDHSREFIGFMPCRIGIIEEPNGDIYLYTMNLDLAIYGGTVLPKKMLDLAHEVETAMYGMIEHGASGEEE